MKEGKKYEVVSVGKHEQEEEEEEGCTISGLKADRFTINLKHGGQGIDCLRENGQMGDWTRVVETDIKDLLTECERRRDMEIELWE